MKEDKLEKLMRDIGLQHLLVTKVPIQCRYTFKRQWKIKNKNYFARNN